jgi:tetratricopeptide (TPR) repeat protein
MKKTGTFVLLVFVAVQVSWAQSGINNGDFKLALPTHQGQLEWRGEGFKIIQSSAKPNGVEIGIRGKDESGRLTFLGFLFLVPGEGQLTSAKCRDGALEPARKGNPTLKIGANTEIASPGNLPVEVVSYSAQGNGKTVYSVRGFIATADICGDLEFYSDSRISADDADLKKIFSTYRFNPTYVPQSNDAYLYAQILYQNRMYQAAAPIFEQALTKLKGDKGEGNVRRVLTDQAGMAYGLSGNIPKARSIFEAAIAKDPDYPLYYYNLACADAGENKLADARAHLQQAFARKANVIPGETMPDPAKDDSFLPYRTNNDFWTFLESLH